MNKILIFKLSFVFVLFSSSSWAQLKCVNGLINTNSEYHEGTVIAGQSSNCPFQNSTEISSATVKFKASQEIILGPGFSSDRGSDFKAYPKCRVDYNDWDLVFSDDFNSSSSIPSSPNNTTGNWYLSADHHGTELQIYQWNNLSVSNGYLMIKADKLTNPAIGSNGTVYNYSSGQIEYNRNNPNLPVMTGNTLFEIKCKMPEGGQQAIWPAFWMWNPVTEIDVFEYNGNQKNAFANNLHWPTDSDCQFLYSSNIYYFSQEYHIFSCAWISGKIVFYLDGIELRTINNHVPDISNQLAVVANFALGNLPDFNNVTFPQYFSIDWIKIYRLKNASNGLRTCSDIIPCDHVFLSDQIYRKTNSTYDKEEKQPEMFKIYPNPASSKIVLEGFEGLNTISVSNLKGVEVLSIPYKNNTEINIENLSSGIYILKIVGNNQTFIEKLVVNR